MLILEKPFVSDTLVRCAIENGLPVLRNEMSESLVAKGHKLSLYNDSDFVAEYNKRGRLYSMSENGLGWINANIRNQEFLDKITLLKDKAVFRKICASLYPDFFFCEKEVRDLGKIDVETLRFPLVLKPSVGFLSIGVYVVRDAEEWRKAVADIERTFSSASRQFPEFVVGSSRFLIEEYIKGEEFAVDAYFDAESKPFILNIYDHKFANEADTSDRLYCSSRALYDEYEQTFMQFLVSINEKVGLRNFPIHIEFRYDGKKAVPIEINPLRFAGFCLNELQTHISGVHPIISYFNNLHINKEEMWKGKEKDTYSFLLLERPAGYGNDMIFNEKKFRDEFMDVLELRPINDSNVSAAASAFIRTDKAHEAEFERILTLDMRDFMIRR